MRHLVWFLDIVELALLDRLPVVPRCWTPPVDLVGTWCAENFHPCRPIREVATQFLVNVEIPGRIGVETGEDRFRVAAFLPGLLEGDLCIAILAEHALKRDVTEHFVSADGTPEELERCRTVPPDPFQTRD